MLAGGLDKIFTPLLGKGLKFWIKGKPADCFYTDINNHLKNIKDSKDKLNELAKISEQCDKIVDKLYSKQDR